MTTDSVRTAEGGGLTGAGDVGSSTRGAEPQLSQTEGANSGEASWSPILRTQKEISQVTQRKAAAVDRWLESSESRVAQAYRGNLEENPGFASMIRGRVVDRRMNAWFKDRFGDVPGVRIDQQIPGSGTSFRPDLYLPNLDGSKVIFDIGGASKIGEINKHKGMADLLFPVTH